MLCFVTMTRTWTLNARELLRLVWEAELDDVLKPVTPKSVGKVGICRPDNKRNINPLQIQTLGRIEFVSLEDAFVFLKGQNGKSHVDGDEGEVYVLEYYKRKKIDGDDLPCSYVQLLANYYLFCVCVFLFCFVT